MTFLHPWALAIGILAAATPVLIHWLTRPRPQRMPLSTIRFVQEAIRQRRSMSRLRDAILLILRTLAILLIAMAAARPQWGERQLSDLQGSDAVRIVILDLSQSMAAREGAVEQIERARTVAAGYLRYRPGLAANLILAGAQPQGVFDGPSTNFEALRDELNRCRSLPERIDVNRALDLAARMLAPASEKDTRRRELVIVSDFQRSSWAKADFSPLPADAMIQLESTAPKEPPVNLAILRVEARSSGANGEMQLDVEVANDSPNARKVTVEVSLGNASWRLTGACPRKQNATLTEEIGTHQPGWQPGEARLVGVDDALAADNVYPFVLRVRPQPNFILMTRQPTGRRATSSLFIECALAPASKSDRDRKEQGASVVRVDPASYDRSTVTAADLIVLDHPGKLSDETVKLLADLLRRGRPILYVAAELIDATNLKRLNDAAGSGLQMPVEFAPPPAGQTRRDLFITSARSESPVFGVFGDGLTTVLNKLRFAGGLTSRRTENGLESDILATYNDGSACIVLTASDAGVLGVVNADLAASNLPKTSAFVPLLSELIGLMRDRHQATDTALCGEPLLVHLPSEAGSPAGLKVLGPGENGNVAHGELIDEAAGTTWRWNSPGPPGVYQIERDGTAQFASAVNIPAEESRLDTLTSDVLTGRLAVGRSVAYHGAVNEGQRRDDFWKWFAVACVICVLGETSALLFFKT